MTALKTVTLKDIRSWGPCYDPIKWVAEDWSGTALDILRMEQIPVSDRFWAVLREEMIDAVTLRLFAADCAEHVLRLYEDKYPGDDRPRKSVEAARAYARGEISKSELTSARDAAWTAGAAAGAAADAARDAAWTAGAAAGAAADAARAAAWTAGAAARAAAWTAGAAAGAAADAARAAAWTAWYAAGDAAGAAAWTAARDAARDAERRWQVARLISILEEGRP